MADDVKPVETATPQPAKEMLPFNIREERDEANNINRIYDATTGVEIGWKVFDGQFYDHWFGKYPAKFYTMSASVEAAVNDALDPAEALAAEAMTSSEAEFEGLIGTEVQADDGDDREPLSTEGALEAVEPETQDVEGTRSLAVSGTENGVEVAPSRETMAQERQEADDTAEVSADVPAEGSALDAAEPEEDTPAEAAEPQQENPLHGALSLVMAMHGGQPIASGQLNAADRVFSQLLVAIAERKLNSLYFTTTDGSNIGWDKPETMAGVA